MKPEKKTAFSEVAALEERYQLATYKKMPVIAERGEGVWLYAADGQKYLDLYGLLFYSNLVYSEARARAAEKLVTIAPASLTKVFFCNSGTEANENAMRMARMATGRENIITFAGGFHGRTADAISATFLGRYRELGKPNVPGHLAAEFGDLESVQQLADDSVAAIMLEPIQSMAGVRMAKPEFYDGLRRLCDERGIVLIYDEVQTGVGRTGEWFFAGSEAGARIVPEVITLAKALGSGIPVATCLVTEKIAAQINENDLGTTFGGGMMAMAAVKATLEAIEQDDMLANVKVVEAHLRESLASFPNVVEIAGKGFLLGLRFTGKAGDIHRALLDRKIITGTSSDPHVLRLLPPLCLKSSEVDLFVKALREVCEGYEHGL